MLDKLILFVSCTHIILALSASAAAVSDLLSNCDESNAPVDEVTDSRPSWLGVCDIAALTARNNEVWDLIVDKDAQQATTKLYRCFESAWLFSCTDRSELIESDEPFFDSDVKSAPGRKFYRVKLDGSVGVYFYYIDRDRNNAIIASGWIDDGTRYPDFLWRPAAQ